MLALIQKELNSFFSAAIGYLVIGVYLLVCGLFLFIFKGPYNLLDNGFSDLSPYFSLAPWVLLFLIPAITMSAVAEERKRGTLELILTKPISLFSVVIGKYLGCFLLVLITLLPGIIYIYTIHSLGITPGNLDAGSTIGSYISLLLLAGSYTAIGLFTSVVSTNQITAFLLGLLSCFLLYYGMGQITESGWFGSGAHIFSRIGMQYHYDRMNLGVIDSRDILYFLFIILLFLTLSRTLLGAEPLKKILKRKSIVTIGLLLFIIPVINAYVYKRIDLTEDQRFTLSQATRTILQKAEVPVTVDVLLEGDLPSEFRRLRQETKQLLDEFKSIQPNLDFVFTNPLKEEEFRAETLEELQKFGLTPAEVSVQESGKTKIETVVPWAILNFKNKTVKVPLLKNKMGETTEQRVSNSIQQLEYVFAEALQKLIEPKKYKIAVLKGNGQLPDKYIADFVTSLQEFYFVGAFTLDSVVTNPSRTLQELQKFDLVINAKPTIAFTEKEKFVIDQYLMKGGRSLWLSEKVGIELDSLFLQKNQGQTVAFLKDLNTTDLLFSYGVRVNPVLINDLSSAPLMLASGEGNNTKFNPYRWFYASLTNQPATHPITKNIEAVKFEFSNQIDTLPNTVKKTILLSSSRNTKLQGVPIALNLETLLKVPPNTESYNQGPQPMAVLLEGIFPSAFKGQVVPLDNISPLSESKPTKMIVVADGDIIKNNIRKGKPVPLGFDPYLNLQYGNKEFLLNAVNYLLEDTGLITIRGKEVEIAFLDLQKVAAEKEKWQALNVLIPLLLLIGFGFFFQLYRKGKYTKISNL